MPSPKQPISETNSRLDKIEQFFLERFPQYHNCGNFREWLQWANCSGYLLRVFPDENEEKILAAAVVRPINDQQFDIEHDHNDVADENGDILYVDVCAADSKGSLRALYLAAWQRFGPRLALSFNSHGRGERVHDYKNTIKALFKQVTQSYA